MSDDELLDYARQCIDGTAPLYELAHKIADARPGRSFTQVMFGACEDESEARVLLKEAETAAWRQRKR